METKEIEFIECPFCHETIKKGNGWHSRNCRKKFIENLTKEQKQKIIDDYIIEGLSTVQMCEKYKLPYSQMQRLLTELGVKLRNVKEATSMPKCREMYANTMLKTYGTTHNFNKDCKLRQTWEKRLFEEEGITNVFQRDDVKEKINKTNYEKYGRNGIYYNRAKGSTLEYWVDKLGEEEGVKKYNEICFNKGKSNRIEYYIELYGEDEGIKIYQEKNNNRTPSHYTGLNDKCELFLIENNIPYEREFRIIREDKIKSYFYDFIIYDDLIIELNGTYWHCSPKKYQPNDLIHFPNNVFIKAKDKWEYDFKKCEYVREHGYIVETIWEEDFNEKYLMNLINNYKLWRFQK